GDRRVVKILGGDTMKKEENKKEMGLPEIAESPKKVRAIAVLVGIVVALSFSLYFSAGPNKKKTRPIEETYSLPVIPDVKGQQAIVRPKEPDAKEIDPEAVRQQVAILQEKQKELQQRLAAPLMLVNVSEGNAATNAAPSGQTRMKD